MPDDLLKVIITALVTIVGSWLVFRGAKRTADASKAASENTSRVDAQASALDAWRELLDPYREEVRVVNKRLDQVNARLDGAHAELDAQRKMVNRLQLELAHWQRLAKVIARWATTLRDQVISLGGRVPATPDELLVIQALDADEDIDRP